MDKKNLYLHSFLKLNYKSFCASWAGLILIFVVAMAPAFLPLSTGRSLIWLPEAKNSHNEPPPFELPTIYIRLDESVCFNNNLVEDYSTLPVMIENKMDELKCRNRYKLLLRADRNIRFGRILEVFRHLPDAQIRTVGLLVDEAIE